ncbi:MAG TPA: hypothetical protein PKX87_04350, partial [Alphaproteobacteria bacterium]|nr:hypothetical protein [Alphaproteobacteria bacterium]
MGKLYTTDETRREIALQAGLGPALETYPGATVVVTHPDGIDPRTGRLNQAQVRNTLRDYGENVASVTHKAGPVFHDLQNESFTQMKARSGPELKTADGQGICLVTGNLTYQSKAESFAAVAYMDQRDLKTGNIPGDAASWATLSALHEIGHCANKDTENETPPLEAEINADKHAIEQYQALAADPVHKLDAAVPQAYMEARILGSAFVGFDPDNRKDTGIAAATLVSKAPEEHDTYLGVARGLSAEESAAASSRANTLIYSMAPQTEKIRLGGAEVFSREHPELAGYPLAAHPGQALDQAGQLMSVQENPALLKNPEEMAQTREAVSNAAAGAILVNKDPSLAYATSQAVLDNGMVPKGSPEETYIKDYMGAMEKYRPQDADKGLAAEVSAN